MDKMIRVAVARVLNTDLTLKQKEYKLLDISCLVLCRKDVSNEVKEMVNKWYDTLNAYNTLKSL